MLAHAPHGAALDVRARRPRGLDGRLFTLLRDHLAGSGLRLRFWDGTELEPEGQARATLTVKDRPTLLRLIWDPELHFGDAYASGRIEMEGDFLGAFESVYRAWRETPGSRLRLSLARLARFGSDTRDIHHHYDIGNDFYRLWLDRQLVYTCAYFPGPDVSLEDAQTAKLDLVCRKVGLRPGQRVVEAGCGWGALALHMARRYGVHVKAYNVSREQVRYARERAKEEGLDGRVEFVEDDFAAIRGPADAFVSVGMIEHAGRGRFRALGETIDRCLLPHGRGLVHFIGRTAARPLNAWIRRRIFPGAYPPTLAEVTDQVLAPFDLSVLDVENLRLHYEKTLAHWAARFEAAARTVAGMFDERFVRMWRVYLLGSQASFSAGSLQLYQIAFARGRSNAIPWTRAGVASGKGDGPL